MLVRLTVENFAILERADLEFAPGLNALTGQTGAGKSLLIDALGCILGERASSGFLRKGCDEGLVEAFFVVEDARLAGRGEAAEPVYIRRPFAKQRDFGVTSVNYKLKKALAKGKKPEESL